MSERRCKSNKQPLMLQVSRFSLIILLLVATGGCSGLTALQYYFSTERKVYPDKSFERTWQLAEPQIRANRFSLNSTSLQSLIVAHDGKIQLEWYADDVDLNSTFNIKSVSKSFLSALVGIAISKQLLNLDEEVDLKDTCNGEQGSENPTVRDLLTMSAGFDFTENQSNQVYSSSDWSCAISQLPLKAPHGKQFQYGTIQSYLLGAWLSKKLAVSLDDYFQQHLLNPLEIELDAWRISPDGIPFAGSEMEMSARDLLAFGQLFLDKGRYNGVQIIPEDWINISQEVVWQNADADIDYGYGWWLKDIAKQPFLMAQGYGGQVVLVQPNTQFVLVSTSTSGGLVSSLEHERRINFVLNIAEQILFEVTQGPPH